MAGLLRLLGHGKEFTWGTSGATSMHSGIGTTFLRHGIPRKWFLSKVVLQRAALISKSVGAVFGGNNTIAGFEDQIRPSQPPVQIVRP